MNHVNYLEIICTQETSNDSLSVCEHSSGLYGVTSIFLLTVIKAIRIGSGSHHHFCWVTSFWAYWLSFQTCQTLQSHTTEIKSTRCLTTHLNVSVIQRSFGRCSGLWSWSIFLKIKVPQTLHALKPLKLWTLSSVNAKTFIPKPSTFKAMISEFII